MRSPPDIVLAGILAAAGLAAACASSKETAQPADPSGQEAGAPTVDGSALQERACPPGSALTYDNFGAPFFLSWCTGCHSRDLPAEARQSAPLGMDFDSLEGIRPMRERIWARAADDNTTMPPVGGPSARQRAQLGEWLACGAPGDAIVLDGGASDAAKPPIPTGACAAKHDPVPPAQLPRCKASTLGCLLACQGKPGSDTCNAACFAADKTPPDGTSGLDCHGCFQNQLIACVDANGCHDQIALALCCLQDKCASTDGGPTAPDCQQTKCGAEFTALQYCLSYVTPDCITYSGVESAACFAGPTDAGGG